MKALTFILALLCSSLSLLSQTDENRYIIRVLNFEWYSKDQLVMTLTKFDQSRKERAVSNVYLYHITTKEFTPLLMNAGRPMPSSDGRFLAYEDLSNPDKTDISIYDFGTGESKPISSDTLYKLAPNWSHNGRYLAYTVKRARYGKIDIKIWDRETDSHSQITDSGEYSSYNPVWSPDDQRLVYYFEKGDNMDQIYLTDLKGTFHRNLSSDTTHNFYPSWIDDHTILHTHQSRQLALMDDEGKHRRVLQGIDSYFGRYNAANGKIAYLEIQTENAVVFYDLKTGEKTPIISQKSLEGMF